MKGRHFLSITDLSAKEIRQVFALAKKLKRQLKSIGRNKPLLSGKTLAMIFEKPSLRTRLSFEVGMTQLGGHAVYLSPSDIGLGKRESVEDVARVVSSMADMIMARTLDPKEAVKDADIVYTDTWVSMGDTDKKERMKIFKPYQVNQKLMKFAKKDAIFMHCLPAHRGSEVTADVIDGPQSVVFEEAENRLHVQKSLMLWLICYY